MLVNDNIDQETFLNDLVNCLDSFLKYKSNRLKLTRNSFDTFKSLDFKYQQLIEDRFLDRIEFEKSAILENHSFFKKFYNYTVSTLKTAFPKPLVTMLKNKLNLKKETCSKNSDFNRVGTVLRQIVRDFSSDGQLERSYSYSLIELALDILYTNDSLSGPLISPDNLFSQLNTITKMNLAYYDISEFHTRLLDCLSDFRVAVKNRNQVQILIPGCGLGRLALELAASGFSVEGNEFSSHMILMSDFFFNGLSNSTIDSGQNFTIYPYLTNYFNNCFSAVDDLLRPVQVPDQAFILFKSLVEDKGKGGLDGVSSELYKSGITSKESFLCKKCKIYDQISPLDSQSLQKSRGNLNISCGNFLDIYNEDCTTFYDCIITCFFIDTSPNIFKYIEKIYQLLKSSSAGVGEKTKSFHGVDQCSHYSGYWINIGPLQYHYAGEKAPLDESSIELSFDEIEQAITKHNFTILFKKYPCKTFYNQNLCSMSQSHYNSVFFVAKKN